MLLLAMWALIAGLTGCFGGTVAGVTVVGMEEMSFSNMAIMFFICSAFCA
jgi:hypothetical protein